MSSLHRRQAHRRNESGERPRVQAAPEYGTLLVGANNLVGLEPRRQPTGAFYWFCPECQRKNVIASSDLGKTGRDCEHCELKVEIMFEPVDQIIEPAQVSFPASSPGARRVVLPTGAIR